MSHEQRIFHLHSFSIKPFSIKITSRLSMLEWQSWMGSRLSEGWRRLTSEQSTTKFAFDLHTIAFKGKKEKSSSRSVRWSWKERIEREYDGKTGGRILNPWVSWNFSESERRTKKFLYLRTGNRILTSRELRSTQLFCQYYQYPFSRGEVSNQMGFLWLESVHSSYQIQLIK